MRNILFNVSIGISIFTYTNIAHSAEIIWGAWVLGAPIVVGADAWSKGNGRALPHSLEAAVASSASLNPSSWVTKNITTTINLSNTFSVTPGPQDKIGDVKRGLLSGYLKGVLAAAGFDLLELTGSYNANVSASVNAGFTNWTSPGAGTSISGSVLLLSPSALPVDIKINKVAPLIVGSTYEFSMELAVNAGATGVYQSSSLFDALTETPRGKLYAVVSISE